MYKIICDFCGNENRFSNRNERPKECSNQACQNLLENLEVITIEDKEEEVVVVEQPKKIIGLKLIYQKTSDEIQLKTEPKIILGRQNFGSKVLSKIKQVSRAHCSIEFADNQFIVKDLCSTNGTFTGLGDDKVNCLEPQILKDKDFLVLGQEVFLVQLLKEGTTELETTEIEPVLNKLTEILCTECSCILKELPCSCPECGTWNE
jgi:hypothetical protein